MKTNNSIFIAVLFAIVSALLITIGDSFTKLVFKQFSINTFTFYLNINIIALLTVMFIVMLGANSLSMIVIKSNKYILLFRSLLSVINFALIFYIITKIPLDIYYSLIFTSPLIASVLAVFLLSEKFNFVKLFAILMGLVGVLIIVNPLSESFSANLIIPIILTLLLSTSIALAAVITRKFLAKEHVITMAFYGFLVASIIWFITVIINQQPIIIYDIGYYRYLIIMVSFTSVASFLLLNRAYQIAPIQIIAQMQYTKIIWGTLLGYMFFSDVPKTYTIIGCILIIISNFMVTWYEGYKKTKRKY